MDGIQAEIRRLAPKPGEVLLVKFTRIRQEQVEEMRRTLNEFMADEFPGVRVLAVTGRVDVGIISKACADELSEASINAII